MKRMVIFIIIGVVFLGVGIAGGMYIGRTFSKTDQGPANVQAAAPGPIISIGEFTVNLAGAGNRILSFSTSAEALNAQAEEVINTQNWMPRMRSEILLIAKDKLYEDLTKAEGVVQFGEQIKRTLNMILPPVNGEVPIVRIMFESFVLQ